MLSSRSPATVRLVNFASTTHIRSINVLFGSFLGSEGGQAVWTGIGIHTSSDRVQLMFRLMGNKLAPSAICGRTLRAIFKKEATLPQFDKRHIPFFAVECSFAELRVSAEGSSEQVGVNGSEG